MLEASPGAFINIGNADTVGSCPCTTRITISTTLHCLLEQVSLCTSWRRSCHNLGLDLFGWGNRDDDCIHRSGTKLHSK
jgi:hypothetical protein